MGSLNKDLIINYLKQHKNNFSEKYSINKLGLFGSFATNNNSINSDIDIAYETISKDLTFKQMYQFEDELNDYFKRDIDLVNLNYMNPLIKRTVIKDIVYV
jgi:predicted nucleotidyltransferase